MPFKASSSSWISEWREVQVPVNYLIKIYIYIHIFLKKKKKKKKREKKKDE